MLVAMTTDNLAIVYWETQYAQESGLPYAEFDSIPDGAGLLKTDLKTLWWEAVSEPEPIPEPTPEERLETLEKGNTLLKAQMQFQTERADLLEGALIEIASMVIE